MALIHGANRIFYFAHEFNPKFREDAIFRCPEIVEEVTNTNRLIMSLAPVLNTPNIASNAAVSSTVPIATMVKVLDGVTYIFAVAMQNSASTALIKVPGTNQCSCHRRGSKPVDC